MIRWLGALMIVLSCTFIGWREQRVIRLGMLSIKDAERVIEVLRLHICIRGLPLPSVLEELERGLPGRFSKVAETYKNLRDVSFADYWQSCLLAGKMCQECVLILTEATESLISGHTPERVLDSAQQQLACAMEYAVNRQQEMGRLPLTFGVAAGCMLVLILL